MGMKWDDPWNDLTQTLQVAIDNDQPEEESILAIARHAHNAGHDDPARRIILADAMKDRYGDMWAKLAPPDHRDFKRKCAGMILNEAVGEINWFGLAEHYLQKIREAKTPDN